MTGRASDVLITLDIDWAPDHVIDAVAQRLIGAGVRATWFVTHACKAVDRLRHHSDLFELGVHPNVFFPESTHGTSESEVLAHCMGLVPEAVSVRMHHLAQSTPLLDRLVEQTPLRVDATLLVPDAAWLHPITHPHNGDVLLRIPGCWEDDIEMRRASPRWHASRVIGREAGLKVLTFHAIHVYLNSPSMEPYEQLKARGGALRNTSAADTRPFVHSGEGVGSLFDEIVDGAATHDTTLRLCDIYHRWRALPPTRDTAHLLDALLGGPVD